MARRWTLRNKHRGKRGGVHLSVPGHKAGRPLAAEVSASLFGDMVIEGDHWEQWSEYLVEVIDPVVSKAVDVVVDVVKATIPGPVDDVLLELAQPKIETAVDKIVDSLTVKTFDKIETVMDKAVDHFLDDADANPRAGQDDDEDDKDDAQPIAGGGAEKLKRLRRKKAPQT